MGIPGHLTCCLRNLYAGQEVTKPDMEHWNHLQLGMECDNPVYCHPAYVYFTYMQSISCKILGWMNHMLGSRLPGEISTTSDMQVIPLNGRKWTRTKQPLHEGERREWKKLA